MLFSDIAKGFIDFVVKNYGAIFSFLLRLVKRRSTAIPIFIIFSALAIFCGYRFFRLSEQYNTIFSGLLKTSTEPTPQEFKGVESFILSVADNNKELTTGVDNIKNGIINNRFIAEMDVLAKVIEKSLKHPVSKVPIPKLQLVPNTEILTDSSAYGFLFLPIYLLNNTITSKELDAYTNGSTKARKKIIKGWFKNEHGLQKEIEFTKMISKGLDRISKTSIIRPDTKITTTPKQVYFITKNGINRIFSKNHQNLEDYYGQHFQARTFFPSRPYFWPTFDHEKVSYTMNDFLPSRNEKVSDYFYVTQPYLDLAWNGFVITLTRGISIDGQIKGVLCIDIPLPLPFSVSLEKALEKVAETTEGINTQKLSFNFDQREVQLEQESSAIVYESESLTQLWNDFSQHVAKNSERKADLLGNILVFNDSQKEQKIEIFVQSGDLTGSQRAGAIGLSGLFISIDINLLKTQLHKYAILAIIFIVFAFLTLTGLYVNTSLIQEELEQAFKNVDLLMDKLPLPYVRLNSSDIIVDFNQSFCKVMNLDDDFNELKPRTFRSFCATRQDEKVYDDIQQKRKDDQSVTPYEIELKGKKKKPLKFIIVSGKFPSSEKGKVPDTFGVLLNADSKSETSFINAT